MAEQDYEVVRTGIRAANAEFQNGARALFNLSSSQFVSTVASYLRNKVLALSVGAAGFGIFSQLQQFVQFGQYVSLLGLHVGMTRETTLSYEDRRFADFWRTVFTSAVTVFSATIVLSALLVVFADELLKFLLGSVKQPIWFLYMAVGAIALTNVSVLVSQLLVGVNRIHELARSQVVISLLGLLSLLILATVYAVAGSVIWIALFGLIQACVNFLFLRPHLPALREKLLPLWQKTVASGLIKTGFAVLVASAVVPLVHISIRRALIKSHGLESAGIYSAVWSIGLGLRSLVGGTISTYHYRLETTRVRENENSNTGLMNRLLMLFLVPLICTTVVFREPVLHILFSPNFVSGSKALVIQSTGELVYALMLTGVYSLLATGRNLQYLIVNVLWGLLFFASGFYLIRLFGVDGAAGSFLFSSVVVLTLIWVLRKTVFESNGVPLLLLSAGMIVVTYFASTSIYIVRLPVLVLILIAWFRYVVKSEERLQIKSLFLRLRS